MAENFETKGDLVQRSQAYSDYLPPFRPAYILSHYPLPLMEGESRVTCIFRLNKKFLEQEILL
jgi:hypothetical protein